MRVRDQEHRRGVIAVLVAVCLVVVVGSVALVADGGLLRDQRRRVQASADAAALAAAYDMFMGYSTLAGVDAHGTAKASALSNASANGYANDGTSSVVTVNIPPTSGHFVGKPGYAEVVVQYNQRRGFSGVFGGGDLAVRGRGVARGQWSTFANGIIVLDPTGQGALNANGGGAVNVKNASVIVNSNHQDGGVATGGGTISAPEIFFSGRPGYSTSGGSTITAALHSGQPQVADPLAYLPQPDPSTMTVQSNNPTHISGKKTVTLYPGVYKGGISISAQAKVTMTPGVYYMMGGGFSFNGSGSLTANGVMIYNAPQSNSDVIDLSGNGTVKLTPPTTGTYAGIALFQQRSSTNTVSITGNGGMTVTGTFYVARGELKVTGNGATDVVGSQYISYRVNLGGTGSLNIDWKAGPTARMRLVGLVE